MPLPPDDLPRSPTGRVPRWVLDEASGGTAPGTVPHPPTGAPAGAAPRPARRRRRPLGGLVAGLLVVGGLGAGAALWLDVADRDELGVSVATALADVTDGAVDLRPSVPPPSAEVVALADAAHLTDEGRALLYATRPEVLDAAAFAGRCDRLGARPARGLAAPAGAVGCFWEGPDRIVVFRPSDARLGGFVVETTAHELLHAAWAELDDTERARLTPLLEVEVARLPADDPLHDQLAGSVGDEPASRPTELFAYLGTQVQRPGGLGADLEVAWGRVVTDRTALVAVHEAWQAVLTDLGTEVQESGQALVAQEAVTATARAQLVADTAARDAYRTALAEQEAEVAALGAAERSRLLLSWTWWDGTELPQASAEETLALARTLLARDDASLAARGTAVAADEARDAAERARVQALADDLERLHDALDPAAGA
ncbi:hypothetical protein [Cellulomonas endophytica]|uniref:hypothetical protein n=1 Tax=Cellulomonas endophytica TaxID=2494735 RepID=UPI001011B8CF|nr:hypothetical protein [Cellulomonas endophytica]